MPFFITREESIPGRHVEPVRRVDVDPESFQTRQAAEEVARIRYAEAPYRIVETEDRLAALAHVAGVTEPDDASAFLRECPGRSVFEGDVVELDHEWGVDYDVQNGGGNGPGPDTWLSEHVLRRFKGKRVRVTIEELSKE